MTPLKRHMANIRRYHSRLITDGKSTAHSAHLCHVAHHYIEMMWRRCKPEPVPLAEYAQMLRRHDWLYQYSDDFGVWERGSREADELERISRQSPDHQRLYDARGVLTEVCAWCERVKVGEQWERKPASGIISHAICPDCFDAEIADLESSP